jgi:hypothetical protein
MSIKSKVFAAAATLTLIGGVSAVGALSANAATPSCGPTCIDLFNNDFGTHAHPNFALDTLKQGEKVGQPQILFRTANFDPALDYTISYQGLVSDFYAAALVSPEVDLHYGAGATGFPDDAAVVRHGLQIARALLEQRRDQVVRHAVETEAADRDRGAARNIGDCLCARSDDFVHTGELVLRARLTVPPAGVVRRREKTPRREGSQCRPTQVG